MKTFEESMKRLEHILEKMHEEKVSLDEALALYEEADGLIHKCQKKLNEAEQKIEILLKDRDGSLKLDEQNRPHTEDFMPTNQPILNQ